MAEIIIKFSKERMIDLRDNILTVFVLSVISPLVLFICFILLKSLFNILYLSISNGIGSFDITILSLYIIHALAVLPLLHINGNVNLKFFHKVEIKERGKYDVYDFNGYKSKLNSYLKFMFILYSILTIVIILIGLIPYSIMAVGIITLVINLLFAFIHFLAITVETEPLKILRIKKDFFNFVK